MALAQYTLLIMGASPQTSLFFTDRFTYLHTRAEIIRINNKSGIKTASTKTINLGFKSFNLKFLINKKYKVFQDVAHWLCFKNFYTDSMTNSVGFEWTESNYWVS